MSEGTILLVGPQGATVERTLGSCLTAAAQEDARVEANRWIKRLRLVQYDARSMRERFTYRGDSLWWFTEIYLHKMRQLDRAIETILALEHAVAADGPASLTLRSDDVMVRHAGSAFGAARGVTVRIEAARRESIRRESLLGFLVGPSAILSRWRQRGGTPTSRPRVAAFVHTAFWRDGRASHEPGRETYIGPVLDALRSEVAADDLRYVGVGPRRNFRLRRWWDPILGRDTGPTVTPIEQLASRHALSESLELWRQRESLAAAIVSGPGIRAAGHWREYDLWPVLSSALADAARVQWPWSARSMDEASAALSTLRPGVVVTYAEAGGWGRALALEARRAGIPSIGLQHGFIYRHWLNYQHEPDEMEALGHDAGFPRPDRTLVFDRYARHTLEVIGHFPTHSVEITGSPRLDELAARARQATGDVSAVRARLGLNADTKLVVVAAKHSEFQEELPAFVHALGAMTNARGVIKPHPAESADVYQPALAGQDRVVVTEADADLGRLLGAADALVTRNSTVAIDALVLGVPAVVVGLPNNLSPFVDAGVMIGADRQNLKTRLESVLYDAEGRRGLLARGAAFARDHDMTSNGTAAARAARAILNIANPAADRTDRGEGTKA